ncbi:MAG: hypothetical protein HGA31_04125 [Candidatus Moranbacteria bacterium]|nr:hypothetical protein [Candidatus Moranbacteria bacterium]
MENRERIIIIGGDEDSQGRWKEKMASRFEIRCVSLQEEAYEIFGRDGNWNAVVVRAFVAPRRNTPYDPHSYKMFNTGTLIGYIREAYPHIPIFGSCLESKCADMIDAGCVATAGVLDLMDTIEAFFSREPVGMPIVIS